MRTFVTDLDSFAFYQRSESMELDEILARLRREEPATDAMRMGTALHHVLEHAQPGDTLDEFEHDGFRFAFMFDEEVALPPVRELRGRKTYDIDGVEVELRGKVDGLDGRTIWDHKLTKTFDVEKYVDAWQWRAYLSIFDCDHMRYSIFIRGAAKDDKPIPLKDFHALDFYRYPEMESDLMGALREYVNFAKVHLPEKFKGEGAAA